MAQLLAILPQRLVPQSGGKDPDLGLYINFGTMKVLEGKIVRVVIYDYVLYDAFRKHKQSNFTDPSDFHKPSAKRLNYQAREPQAFVANSQLSAGVLLVLDGHLELATNGWCFGPMDAVIPQNAGGTRFTVSVAQKPRVTPTGATGEMSKRVIVGTAAYRGVDMAQVKQGKLAVRIILLEHDLAPYKRYPDAPDDPNELDSYGTVLASSLCPDHCASHRLIPIDDSAFQEIPATIGGPTPPPPQGGALTSNRELPNDLSGFYWAEHPAGTPYASPVAMQLNQAGHAIVGWFQRTHPCLMAKLNEGPDIPNLPIDSGCFAGELVPGSSDVRVRWDAPGDNYDPFPRSTPNMNKPGRLVHILGGPADEYQRVRLTLYDQDKKLELTFNRRQAGSRTAYWTYARIRMFIPDFKDRNALRFSDMEALPDEFFEYLKSQVTTDNLALTAEIMKWQNGNDIEKDVACAAVSNILMAVLPTSTGSDRYINEVTSRARQLMGRSQLTDQSVLHWMYLMGATQLDQLRKSTNAPDLSATSAIVEYGVYPAFWVYRLISGKDFRYTFTFKNKGGDWKLVTAGTFVVQIKKERKVSKVVNGQTTKTWEDVSAAAGFSKAWFAGGYVGGGANFGVKLSIKGGAGGPSGPPVLTACDLFASDFEGATFSITTLAAGNANTPLGSVNLFKSCLFQVWNDRFSLATDLTDVFSGSLAKTPPTSTATEITLLKASQLLGHLTLSQNVPKTEFEEDNPPNPKTTTTTVATDLSINYLFARDSYAIADRDCLALEEHLAVFRKLTESDEGTIRTIGYASPEGKENHNLVLSQQRAKAVLEAVQGSLASSIMIPSAQQTFTGKGEATARSVGDLLDPPPKKPDGSWDFPPGTPDAIKQRYHYEETTYWKDWRMVWLVIKGMMTLRVPAK